MRPDTSCGGDGDEVPVTDSHVCLDERSLLAAGPLKHGVSRGRRVTASLMMWARPFASYDM